MKKGAAIVLLSLLCISAAFYFLSKEEKSAPKIGESKTDEKTITSVSAQIPSPKENKSEDFTDADVLKKENIKPENNNPKTVKVENKPLTISTQKPTENNEKSVDNVNKDKQCTKKFEDFGILLNEQSLVNTIGEVVLSKGQTNAQIVELKVNGKARTLPIQDLSDGKYVFEISDQYNCKYLKILKVNQLNWESGN